MKRVAAEALGTALLLAAVVGSGIMAERLAGGNVAVALLANTIATGAGLVALILAFGPASGAHLNPVVTLADRAFGGGIAVDASLRTSDPDIFAAGDVAEFHNSALGRRIRVEHEDNANSMGAAAGRAMAGAEVEYDYLPFFYSDLFDLGYEAVGELDSRLEAMAEWKTQFREGVIRFVEGGVVRGVLNWGIFGQVDEARAQIGKKLS